MNWKKEVNWGEEVELKEEDWESGFVKGLHFQLVLFLYYYYYYYYYY